MAAVDLTTTESRALNDAPAATMAMLPMLRPSAAAADEAALNVPTRPFLIASNDEDDANSPSDAERARICSVSGSNSGCPSEVLSASQTDETASIAPSRLSPMVAAACSALPRAPSSPVCRSLMLPTP